LKDGWFANSNGITVALDIVISRIEKREEIARRIKYSKYQKGFRI
jgi:hypothetical protein